MRFETTVNAWRCQRVMLRFAVFLLLGGVTLLAAPPNIVYIISDDQTADDFGFMGSKEALTPHIDKLAARSARFPNGYVPSSLCSPSLASMLTGLYPHQSGLHYNHPPPGNSAFNKMTSRAEYEAARRPAFEIIRTLPTLPRTLAEKEGFRSLQTGKFWEGHFSNAGFTEGMTIFEPAPGQDFGGNRTLANGELAAHGNGDHGLKIGRETMQPIADFLDRHPKIQPFLIWYAPYLPHQPHDSPLKYFDLHRDRGLPPHRIPYLAAISQIDDSVCELVAMIEQRDLMDNTLFVFVIDNGWTPDTTPEKKRPEEIAHDRRPRDPGGGGTHFLFGFHTAKGGVTSHDEVRRRCFLPRAQRFILHHIEPRARQPPLAQRGENGDFLHDGTARGVHQEGGGSASPWGEVVQSMSATKGRSEFGMG